MTFVLSVAFRCQKPLERMYAIWTKQRFSTIQRLAKKYNWSDAFNTGLVSDTSDLSGERGAG